MIDTKPIARKTNGQFVYSYYNLSKIYTQGIESNIFYSPTRELSVSLGYQLLIAKDKAVEKQLEDGKVYARDPETGITYRVKEEDYGGLFNRSRHMVNVKVYYENKKQGICASARLIYRGRYGFADNNNNSILDNDGEYVQGYFNANVSMNKTFVKILKLQIGCDNLFNYMDEAYIIHMKHLSKITFLLLTSTLLFVACNEDDENPIIQLEATAVADLNAGGSKTITGNSWYTYTGEAPSGPQHAILPIAGKILMLKTAYGKYVKVEILSYYEGNPDITSAEFADLGTRPASRYYTFRFVYQADGTLI